MADQTRLKILFSLINERECTCVCSELNCCAKCMTLSCLTKKCVGDISKEIGASLTLVSHQLKILKDNDVVISLRNKNRIYYSLKDGHIKEILNVIKEHAEEK